MVLQPGERHFRHLEQLKNFSKNQERFLALKFSNSQFQCATLRYGHMSLPSPNSIRPNNPAGSTPEGVLRRKRQANWILKGQNVKHCETTTENAAVGAFAFSGSMVYSETWQSQRKKSPCRLNLILYIRASHKLAAKALRARHHWRLLGVSRAGAWKQSLSKCNWRWWEFLRTVLTLLLLDGRA